MKLLDITALAVLFDLNEAHIRDRLSKRRDFPPAYRIGGALRWKADEIYDWIDARRITPAARRSKKPTRGSRSATPTDSSVPTSAQAPTAAESSQAA